MPIRENLSDLPQGDKPEGRPPDENPDIVGRLAEAFYAKYTADGHDTLAMAVEGARWRASWSDMCSRRVGYEIAGLEQTDPPGLAEFWRFNLGTFVHEAMQALAADAFPGAEAEVNVAIDSFGAAHVDLVIDEQIGDGDGHSREVRAHHEPSPENPDLLAVDGIDERVRLRVDSDRQEQELSDPSAGLRTPGRPHPSRDDDRPPVPSESVLQSEPSRTSDTQGEHSSGRDDRSKKRSKGDMSGGSSLRHGPENAVGGTSPALLGLLQSEAAVEGSAAASTQKTLTEKPKGVYRTVVEIKSDGGYHFKISTTNWKGPAEGPRSSAVVQGAVSAEALNADRLIVAVFALELLSPDMAAKAGRDELGRFAAQWSYLPDEFLPIAEKERKRVRRMIEIVDEGGLVPRHVPSEMPPRARITDPARSGWTVQDDSGAIVMAGQVWNGQYCSGYCPHFSRCLSDGPS